MPASPTLRVVAPLVIGALALTACGSKKESGSDGGSGSKTLVIGVVAPLSGDLSAVGNGIKNGVDLAIKQANASKAVPGYTLQMDAEDDTAKADVGATVAARFVSNASVVGVVGPLNSSVGESVAPVLSQADLVEISPSNSSTTLTGRDALTTGKTQTRPYKSYFRVVATDDIQGPFGAQYAVKTLNKKTIAIVNDKKAYGTGLSAAFAAEAKKDGATVLPTQSINPGQKDFSAVITKIKPAKPDFLFYGGEYPEAGLLTKQLKAAGLDIPLMGGDGVNADAFITTAGSAANGDFATSLGAPTSTLASAKQFLSDYTAAGYKDPADPYGGYAFDSANAIIKAIASAVSSGKSGSGLRDAVTAAVQSISFAGVTGAISFDQFGDTNSKVLTVYAVKAGKFVPVNTAEFK